MVDVKRINYNDTNPVFKIKDETKSKSTYTVHKSNDGFPFFEVLIDKGSVPATLSGRFTTPDKAIKAVEDYLKTKRVSQNVERDNKAQAREQRKNAKSNEGVSHNLKKGNSFG